MCVSPILRGRDARRVSDDVSRLNPIFLPRSVVTLRPELWSEKQAKLEKRPKKTPKGQTSQRSNIQTNVCNYLPVAMCCNVFVIENLVDFLSWNVFYILCWNLLFVSIIFKTSLYGNLDLNVCVMFSLLAIGLSLQMVFLPMRGPRTMETHFRHILPALGRCEQCF